MREEFWREAFFAHFEGISLLDKKKHGINIKEKKKERSLLLEKELLKCEVHSQALKYMVQLEARCYAMVTHEV